MWNEKKWVDLRMWFIVWIFYVDGSSLFIEMRKERLRWGRIDNISRVVGCL